MTDRYVGIGGNDGNDGLSWANRKLTLNGAEDTPVVAGDTVYVGPGTYRELLTVDVAGNVTGGPITYIGDVSGENTDSIGGAVRITGSDDDQSAARANCITLSSGENYRTFRGFSMDGTSNHLIVAVVVTNLIVEDCYFEGGAGSILSLTGASQSNHTIRRCVLNGARLSLIVWTHSATVDNTSHLLENCLLIAGGTENVQIARIGGITVKNCTFIGGSDDSIDVTTALSGGQTITVNNNVFYAAGGNALEATVTGEITEDYNTFWANQADRSNVITGGNSVTYPPTFVSPLLLDGFVYPWRIGVPSEFSQTGRKAGTGEAADDLFGIVRPTTSAKRSWGAFQLREAERETGTVQTGSAALTLADAGDHQVFVPVTATSTTFEVAARYESEYAGTLPRLIVRQPGQADQVDTMVAAADTWETLSLTFTPNATPPYVIIILRSLNTSVTGDFDTYWDDLDVS